MSEAWGFEEGNKVYYGKDGSKTITEVQTSTVEILWKREEVSWWKDIDWKAVGHGILDVVGMIPVLGEVADLANAAWYTAEGDYTNAAICVAAMVPIAGIGVIGAKIANNGFKAWRKSKQVKKAIDVTADNSVKQSSKSIADNLPAPGCFVAGTLVWSADSLIRIEDIEIGDSVYAYNTTSNSLSIQVVREAYVRTVNKLVRLTTNTETIYTTVEHPFYVNNGWVNASHLHAGDTLFSATSATIIVNSIFFIDTLVNVYNFTVETDHDYFVGESGVLVHNNDCGASGSGSLSYKPTKKHGKGGWGTKMDLDDITAQRLLDNSISSGKQRYNYHNGKLYEFQPDNVGGWHGYPIKGNEAPQSVLNQLKDSGIITNAEYNRLIKGK